ncbi:hypothetical protein [Lysinibacillus sp. 38-6]|uniref:hypothetical protein n=1 Tax=Lysinibacillus sp. 38-6 TaxID=3385991 RepID=UPI0039089B53
MKKYYFSIMLSIVVVFLPLSFESFNVQAVENEETQLLTPVQIKEINVVLEELRIQVNDRLNQGETDITVFGDLSFQEDPISLTFQVEVPNARFVAGQRNVSLLSAVQQRANFRAEVHNTAGFNFSHLLTGSFLWGAGKIGNISYDATLHGALYGKTHSTNVTRLDPSVAQVSSVGKFRALRFAPVEYTTHIVVELYGSGHYSLKRAVLG